MKILRMRVRTLMLLVVVAAVTLAYCRVRRTFGVVTLSVAGRDIMTYYPRELGGPELDVWKPHTHPGSCWVGVYYLTVEDCPVLVGVGRHGVRWNYRKLVEIVNSPTNSFR